MREPQLPSGERHDDLPRVHVAREDELEGAVRESLRDPGEVAEEDANVGIPIGEARRVGSPTRVALRVDPDELYPPASDLDLDGLVTEHHHVSELGERSRIDPLREGVAGVGEVVVPEDDKAGPQPAEQPLEQRQPRAARHQVAREAHEVGLPFDDPLDGSLGRPPAARRDAEVKVGEVRDPEPVELRWHAHELDLDDAPPEPARLEPAPGERSRGERGEDDEGVRRSACRRRGRPTRDVA